ncbi:hypothetical protein HanIR_Chr06g0274791 [Helianthus annuus]|nr:hypothetical protein HanIR_Chr06g0274791 [Helianthus annuus]
MLTKICEDLYDVDHVPDTQFEQRMEDMHVQDEDFVEEVDVEEKKFSNRVDRSEWTSDEEVA